MNIFKISRSPKKYLRISVDMKCLSFADVIAILKWQHLQNMQTVYKGKDF